MAGNIENEQLMRKAMKLLHSSHPNSATELRLMIDEIVKQRYGPEKMLITTLGKRLLEEEANFPGRAVTPPPQPEPMQTDTEEVINLTNSPPKTISDSPDTIVDSDDAMSNAGGAASGLSIITNADDDGNLKEFGDLNCCVCGDMMFTATNRLIECSKCGSLYHQECHKPPIPDEEATEDQQHSWQCDSCLNKPSTSKAAIASSSSNIILTSEEPISLISKSKSSSSSSSSSNSNSPFYKQEAPSTSSTSSKSNQKSSSTSKSSREERSSKSSASSPAVNVITSAEKSAIHSTSSKKSSHSSSTKSSSSKSSKHHDSKRKSK